ncbi:MULTISPECIES: hypothetical protein [Methanobacterium]|nr:MULTISPECIES: hypothetical protein [Methanobacterium]
MIKNSLRILKTFHDFLKWLGVVIAQDDSKIVDVSVGINCKQIIIF